MAQTRAVVPNRQRGLIIAAVPPVLGVVTGFLVGRADGVATTVAVFVALVVIYVVRALLDRDRARVTPVLLLEAEGDRVVLQLAIPDGKSAQADDESVKPLPPRRKLGVSWPIGLFVSVFVVLLGWSGTFDRSTLVLVDSPRRPVHVAIDDDTFDLAAGGRAMRKLRAGTHAFEIVYQDDDRETVRGQLESRANRGVLLSTDQDQCYAVWMDSASRNPARHDHGAVWWMDVDGAERGFERVACGLSP